MLKFWWIVPALWLLVALWTSIRGRRRGQAAPAGLRRQCGRGARRLYSRRGFLLLASGIGASALLVYSGADVAVDRWHAAKVKGFRSDAASTTLHEFGERFWLFYWALVAALDRHCASSALTRHGRESFAALLIGLPMLWSTQRVLGAARPSDGRHGPRFVPFADDNAASGHAFIAATPWFVAMRLVPSPRGKALCALAVPWVGWSRLNDRKHYLGQILLGGWIAYLASGAVHSDSESEEI